MEIIGYKLFNGDLTNQYGDKFVVGREYTIDGKVSFGVTGNGFHFASRLEDTLRYGEMDNLNVNCVIGLVQGFGEIVTREDEYYGYYDLHCSSKMKILKILSREEILEEAKKMCSERLCRFIQGFYLTVDEQDSLMALHLGDKNVEFYINYYQNKKSKTK